MEGHNPTLIEREFGQQSSYVLGVGGGGGGEGGLVMSSLMATRGEM